MTRNQTLSDAELRRRIERCEKALTRLAPGGLTAQWFQKDLEYYRQQLAAPRAQRCQYQKGSL